MKMRLDSGVVAEIDVFFRENGEILEPSAKTESLREEIIREFKRLY